MLISCQLSGVKNFSSTCSNLTEPLFVLSVTIHTMMARISKIIGIILILFLAGCTKDDELKLPVKTDLVMEFAYPLGYAFQDSFDGHIQETRFFKTSGGLIGIQKIDFEGIREAGENIFFETDLEMVMPITDIMFDKAVISNFDLPQGVYKYMRLDIYLQSVADEWFIDEETVSPELKLNTGFVIEGAYGHSWIDWDDPLLPINSFSIPVFIAIDKTERFTFRTFKGAVIKQPDCEIRLSFVLENVLTSLDYTSFEEAEISGEGSNQKIIISSTHNRDLYEIVLYRLGLSTGMYVVN